MFNNMALLLFIGLILSIKYETKFTLLKNILF